MGNIKVSDYRRAEYGCDPLFVERWSPRAMSGEPIRPGELMPLIEAAKWAPSSFNNQPWRFIYGYRDKEGWKTLLGLLEPGNASWAKNAGVLIVVVSKKTFDYNGKPSRTHHFDAGAAWASLALEGSLRGLVVHGMEGFDYDRAKAELKIPDDYDVEAMIAVGKPGRPEDLPEKMRQREVPSTRKSVSQIAFEGYFKSSERSAGTA